MLMLLLCLLSSLTVLPRLLENDNEVVLGNICWSLHHIMTTNRLNCDQLNEMIKGSLHHLLKAISNAALPPVQQPALMYLHQISSVGGACIQSIVNANGLVYVSKALYSPLAFIQIPASQIISNIFASNTEQTLNKNTVSGLLYMMKSEATKSQALKVIGRIAANGSSTQINSLVMYGCISHLCEVLTESSSSSQSILSSSSIMDISATRVLSDVSTATAFDRVFDTLIPLCANCILLQIIKASKKEIIKRNEQALFGKHLIPLSNDNESKLEELMNKVQQIEQQIKCIELLQQKNTILDLKVQNEHIKSLPGVIASLKKQKEEAISHFGSNEGKIVSVNTCFDKQISIVESELRTSKLCFEVQKSFQVNTPSKVTEWSERIKNNDLQAEVKLINEALDGASSNLKTMKSTLVDAVMAAGIEKLLVKDKRPEHATNSRKMRGRVKTHLYKRRGIRKRS